MDFGALPPENRGRADRAPSMAKTLTITTACPRNCYSTCSMRVVVEDGRLQRIEAHPANQATPEASASRG